MSFEKQYDLVFYIGRFEPFHNAHLQTVRQALRHSERVTIVIGSANAPRTPKNPFTAEERAALIYKSLVAESLPTSLIDIIYSDDFLYDLPRWIRETGKMFDEQIAKHKTCARRVAVTGYDKDKSSYYLNYFPQFGFLPMDRYPKLGNTIDATKIRHQLFNEDYHFIKGVVPAPVYDFIDDEFIHSDEFARLKAEYYDIQHPFVPKKRNDVATDAVVIQSGHILLIERGGVAGKGLFALPGGFLETDETLLECVIRELREETMLKVPEKVLKGSIKASRMFDEPKRSLRGRILTMAYLFHLDDSEKLPKVRGADDAKKAFWVPLAEFDKMCPKMFDDHWHLAQSMLNDYKS